MLSDFDASNNPSELQTDGRQPSAIKNQKKGARAQSNKVTKKSKKQSATIPLGNSADEIIANGVWTNKDRLRFYSIALILCNIIMCTLLALALTSGSIDSPVGFARRHTMPTVRGPGSLSMESPHMPERTMDTVLESGAVQHFRSTPNTYEIEFRVTAMNAVYVDDTCIYLSFKISCNNVGQKGRRRI